MAAARYLTAAFYLFVDLPDYAQRRPALLDLCLQRGVKGLILLAREGINSTIAGAPDDVHAVLAYLRADLDRLWQREEGAVEQRRRVDS